MTVMLVVTILLAATWDRAPILTSTAGLITAVLTIQAWFPAGFVSNKFNSVSWSLSAEAFFYLLFPLIIGPLGRARPTMQVRIASAGVVTALAVTLLLQGNTLAVKTLYLNPLVRWPEFLLGVVLALRMKEGWRSPVGLTTAVIVTVCGLLTVTQLHLFAVVNYVALVGFVLVIAAAAARDIDDCAGPLTNRTSIYLGKVSFCFYLTHLVVSNSVLIALGWEGRRWAVVMGWLPVLVALACSLVAAVGLHHAVEIPAERMIRRAWGGRRARRAGGHR